MTSKKTTDESSVRKVPFRSIYIPDSQIRSDEPKVKELAESIKENGQIYPVLVTEGGPDGKDYTLNEGFRRCAAFVLNDWQDREIEVKVIAKKNPFDRIAINWIANMNREDINFLDQCECVGHYIDGTYAVLPGEKAAPIERYEIAQRLRISTGQVTRMYRVFKNLDPDVASLARKADIAKVSEGVTEVPNAKSVRIPSWLLLDIAKIEGEGDDEDKKQEDKARKQAAVLHAFIEKRRKLEEEGRVRSERSDKGSKKNGKHGKNTKNGKGSKHDEEPAGVVAPEKKLHHAIYKNDKDRPYSVEDYVTVLAKKQKVLVRERNIEVKRPTELSYREQVIRLNGIIDGMRLFKGEITRLPDLTKEDFEVLNPPEESVAGSQ